MNNLVIPKEWLDTLDEVTAIFPGATIAGGALRDLDHSRPVKDVDIFCPIDIADYEEDAVCETVYNKLKEAFGETNIELIAASTYHNAADDLVQRDLYCVYRILNRSVPFEIIVGTPHACNVNSFDLSLCQIVLSSDGTTFRTEHYIRGYERKECYVTNINRRDRQTKRLERILGKYPDYKNGGETDEAKRTVEKAEHRLVSLTRPA